MVGTVIGGFDGRRGLIYHLAVEPGFRKRGIGSLLMEEVERRLKGKGCLRCYLMVTAKMKMPCAFMKPSLGNIWTQFSLTPRIYERLNVATDKSE